jgi:hypothetical protein
MTSLLQSVAYSVVAYERLVRDHLERSLVLPAPLQVVIFRYLQVDFGLRDLPPRPPPTKPPNIRGRVFMNLPGLEKLDRQFAH